MPNKIALDLLKKVNDSTLFLISPSLFFILTIKQLFNYYEICINNFISHIFGLLIF